MNLHINAGIRDGYEGSVPLAIRSLAFNAVAKRKDRLSESEIAYFVEKAEVALRSEIVDATYGEKKPLFRRTSGSATLTIFDGGHELIAPAAIAWIEAMDRKN